MEGQVFVRPFVTVMVALTSCVLQATTIVPFANLGSLSDGSDALVLARVEKKYEYSDNGQTFFRFRLVVEESIKGSLKNGDYFDVQKWEKLIDERWITMWGDINLDPGSRYLMFLEQRDNGLYHPLCFSYYIFEEITKEGNTYIVPSPESREMEVVDLNDAEPLYVYHKVALFRQLRAYLSGLQSWTSEPARADLSYEAFGHHDSKRSAPGGCTFLNTSGKKLRWNVFPDQNVGIHYGSGAAGCNTSVAAAQQAISNLQNAYEGINIVDAGGSTFVANCADFSAVGADFRTYMDATYGSSRHVIIQFDDPCGEISDLKNCGGTLAIGGAYGVGSHTYLDTAWATAKYGYVIVNNGVGTCKCSSLSEILTHELTHTLGLGHISSTFGTANLNPACCQPITNLDLTCVDYSYPPSGSAQLLPVELISFTGVANPFNNKLTWITASEENVQKFIVERSDDSGSQFTAVGEVISSGETETGNTYQWEDQFPKQSNYYRLRTLDLDGSEELSNIIALERVNDSAPAVFPTITENELNIFTPIYNETYLSIYSLSGTLLDQRRILNANSQIEMKNYDSGWYVVKVENNSYSEVFRIMKI